MKIEILPDADAAALRAASLLAAEARAAVAARGRFAFAVSGGRSPWIMLGALASENVPWEQVQIAQVDERIAPAGDADRNFTHLHESLLDHVPLDDAQVHAMHVEAPDAEVAARQYAQTLERCVGAPPTFDLIHLGLGTDGHTASLIPGDPVLDVADAPVAVTGVYHGRRRLTLTYPVLNRARFILWLITGADKAEAFGRLRRGDASIPAGRIRQEQAVVVADRAAAGPSGVF